MFHASYKAIAGALTASCGLPQREQASSLKLCLEEEEEFYKPTAPAGQHNYDMVLNIIHEYAVFGEYTVYYVLYTVYVCIQV